MLLKLFLLKFENLTENKLDNSIHRSNINTTASENIRPQKLENTSMKTETGTEISYHGKVVAVHFIDHMTIYL